MVQTIGISDMQVSGAAADVLVTYSLGSCVGLTAVDPTARVGGLLHCLLPWSSLDPAKAKERPCMFVDTGIAALLAELEAYGARRERLVIKAAGAASMLDEQGLFRIGERNWSAARQVLARHGLTLRAADVGGTIARSLYLYLESGRTVVRSRSQAWDL